MADSRRMLRVASLLREHLSEVLLLEAKDPRVANVVVTNVKVTRDLSLARVYVSGVGDRGEILSGLESCKGFLRRQVAARVSLFRMPRLEFFYDDTGDVLARIERLLADTSVGTGSKDDE